jgi:putative CRISPR-associated protein (TIGR02619 family)
MKLILSTIGTSLLTNQVSGEQRTELFKASNLKEKEYSSALIGLIEYIKETLDKKLKEATEADLRRLSAEMNGILGVYEGAFPENSQDIHVLVATDTYQGKVTTKIIEDYLQTKNLQVITYTPQNLTTASKTSFMQGIKDLLKWFDDSKGLDIEKYKENKYEVIFNLTGGFKSLQGYLNTIGMFYADRMVYIFEAGNELIEIPKLPIELNPQLFLQNAIEFSLMYNDLPCHALNIPKLMLEEYDRNAYILSDWGMLAWNKVKKRILSEQLLVFPSLKYDKSFEKDFQKATQQERIELQETLSKVSAILQQNKDGVAKLKQEGGLQYDNYAGKNTEIGHFRINQGDRVSCTIINNELNLRHFGQHDYVNDNP